MPKQKTEVFDFIREEAAYYFNKLRIPEAERPALELSAAPEKFAADDPDRDDAFRLSLAEGRLRIEGSNARSCLIAFYRFLYELGVRFPRPGREYEIFPEACELPDSLQLEEEASYRHRGVCIEGADSVENVLDFIDWLPKIYCNSFFLQFFYSYDFLRKWYAHFNNPLIKPEHYSLKEHLPHDEAMTEALQSRGLLQQRVGHGWTAQALGFDGLGWDAADQAGDPEKLQRAAEIDGKRELVGGRPLLTNLCLSDEDARRAFVQAVADYAEAHEAVDVLHVWLADSLNSVCECEACRKTQISDQYVLLLNEIDEELTARHIGSKICFLIYLDLLWPPRKAILKNPERFILMFAPISRTFEKSLADTPYPPEVEMPPYKRNAVRLPVNLAENLTFLHGWQAMEKTDSFIYDYPLGRAHYGDLGYMKISRVIAKDTEELGRLGLNGYISCQELRTALPSALPNYVMGHKLWQKDASAEALEEDYFKSVYGGEGEEIKAALLELSRLSDTDYVNGKMAPEQPELAERFRSGEEASAALERHLQECLKGAQKEKERLYMSELLHYAGYARRMFRALALRAEKDVKPEDLEEAWKEVCLYLQEGEHLYQKGFDVYRLIEVASHFTKMPPFDEPFPGYAEQMTMRKLE